MSKHMIDNPKHTLEQLHCQLRLSWLTYQKITKGVGLT
jgi:hypothetical protein